MSSQQPAAEAGQLPAEPHGIDPYRLDPADVVEPPKGLGNILKRIGPGIILCASIVGSGELIATTTLGATAGYAALWVILLSCFIKPAIQVEMARYTIGTGETGLEAFDRFPGPRWKVNWMVWAWALMVATTLFQVGAMYGGVAQVLHQLAPAVPVDAWVFVCLIVTLVLLLGGGYDRIESIATIKVSLFTMLTVMGAILLISMPQYFSWSAMLDGLRVQMPPGGLTKAVAVFGITGVGATELFMYPYWCVEKGYARFAGAGDGSKAWENRARGWVRVMEVDVVASMCIYTLATLAFYMLGAGILHGMGLMPKAGEMINVLSNMYTQTLGGWALWLFYLGAVATLYGTVFAATAAHSRLYADMFRMMGFFRRDDYSSRVRYRKRFVWLLAVAPAGLYWVFREPVQMVFIGGLAQFLIMPAIAIVTLYLRHKHLPKQLAPSTFRTWGAWISAAAIVAFGVVYLLTWL
jgi:manganese transport protein